MKIFVLTVLAGLTVGLFTGCEHEEHEHHHGYYGNPAPYEYGHRYETVNPAPGYDPYARPLDPHWYPR